MLLEPVVQTISETSKNIADVAERFLTWCEVVVNTYRMRIDTDRSRPVFCIHTEYVTKKVEDYAQAEEEKLGVVLRQRQFCTDCLMILGYM